MDREEALSKINDLKSHDWNLTDWELSFIDDIENRICDDKHLTDAQLKKLDQIWSERA